MRKLFCFASVTLLACAIAPAQDWAKARLEKSPRHLEWVKVKNGSRTVDCYVAYPEVKDKATAVIVIHEIFGLTDWVRTVADQLAEAGYIAITPDLLSGVAQRGGTAELGGRDAVGKAIRSLPPEQITGDLNAVGGLSKKTPVVPTASWQSQGFAGAAHNPSVTPATTRI